MRPFALPRKRFTFGHVTVLVASVVTCTILLPQAAHAQPSAAKGEQGGHAAGGAGQLVPPRLLTSTEVAYPEGGDGDETVELTVTVGTDGRVSDMRITKGREPFASAALKGASAWRFEPATRAEAPIAARIRLEVAFRAPRPAPVEPAPQAPAAPGASAVSDVPSNGSSTHARAPAPGAPEDVLVRGARIEPGASSLGRAEVRQLPGAFGDPFRAIESLPGVTPIVSGLPFFYVRGAPPGNVGYFIDGIRVPYLFHAGAGPSVIHPGLVDRVDLYPGGYPAKFGRFAGGIVAADITAPRTEFHGEGNLRLFDAGALAESGFAGGKGTALVAGRYSYTAAILSLIAKDTTLAYRDYEARASYDLTPRDRLSVLSFGSFDYVGQNVLGVENVLFGSEFYRLDTRYDHRFGEDTTARLAVTLSYDQTRIPGQPRNSQMKGFATRSAFAHRVSENTLLRFGTDATLENYTADARPYSDPDDPDAKRFNALFPSRTDVNLGAYADLRLSLPRWELTPGLRVDLYESGGATAVGLDPRVSSRIEITRKVHVIHTLGLAHQPPSFLIPIPGLAIGNLSGGLQRSIQASGGVEVEVPEVGTLSVTAFDNVFQNMSDTLGVTQTSSLRPNYKEPRSLGSAVGLEVYFRRRLTKRLGGYLSYTLSRSTRSTERERFLSAFDRPHVLNAAVAFDLGRNWRAGTRFTIYSGTPVLAPGGGNRNGLIPPPRSLDPERDPLFYRFDFRIEKRWNLSKSAWLAFVAEMMNATFHQEVSLGQTIGPVTIPSIGLEGGF
ncbi:MAG: TonB family protein [Polyangiaceae bacterium]